MPTNAASQQKSWLRLRLVASMKHLHNVLKTYQVTSRPFSFCDTCYSKFFV